METLLTNLYLAGKRAGVWQGCVVKVSASTGGRAPGVQNAPAAGHRVGFAESKGCGSYSQSVQSLPVIVIHKDAKE